MRQVQTILLATLCLFTTTSQGAGPALHNQTLTVSGKTWTLAIPSGMQLELLTDRLKQPRLMEFQPNSKFLYHPMTQSPICNDWILSKLLERSPTNIPRPLR